MVSYNLYFDPDKFHNNKPFYYCQDENEVSEDYENFAHCALVEVSNLWIKNNYGKPQNLTKDVHKTILNELILTLMCEYGSNVPFFRLQPIRFIIRNDKNTFNTFGIKFTFDDYGINSCIFYTDRDKPKFEDCERFDSEEIYDIVDKWCDLASPLVEKTCQV